jgi:hypothetical protein
MNTNNILDKIQNCILDTKGVFKYIQIYVKETYSDKSKYVVRGYKKHPYHDDNFQDFTSMLLFNIGEIDNLGLAGAVEFKCVGGGRVNVKDDEKSVLVYGYSQGI